MAPDALSVIVSIPSCHRASRLSSRTPCPWGEVRTSLWRIRGGLRRGAGCTAVCGCVGATQPDSNTIAPASSRRFMAPPAWTVDAHGVQAAAVGTVDEIGASETSRLFSAGISEIDLCVVPLALQDGPRHGPPTPSTFRNTSRSPLSRRKRRRPCPSRRVAARDRHPRRIRLTRLVAGLEEPRGALAAADTHGHDAVARLRVQHLVGDRAHHARAGHAERVADRDRAAVPVELLWVEAEPVATVDDLRGEGLVQLPDVDVADLEARAPEELRHREDRTDPHLLGRAAGDREAAEDELGPDAELLRALHGHHERGARAVGELGGVARGHRALTALLVEVRRERQETLQRRVGAVTLVLVAVPLFLADDLARLLVEDAARDVHRCKLLLEEALPLGAGRPLLAEQSVAVLGLAADLVALGDDLGRIAHHHVDPRIVLLHPRVRRAVPLGHRDRLDAAADHDVGAVVDDVVGRDRDRLEPRGAEAVHREATDAHREPGADRRDARDVVALRAVGLAAAENHVLDLRRVELWDLAEDVLDAVGGEVVRPREVERAAERLGERRAGARDDDGFTHGGLL